MQNIVGQIASKENFFNRPREIKRITRNLQAGANIQLAAPRRVGKSSILHFFLNNPLKGFIFIYIDVESVRTTTDFYRKIYREVLRNEDLAEMKNLFKQLTEKAGAALKKLKNIKLAGIAEIDLREEVEVDYEEELLNFLGGIELDGDRLVIMVDEFPEVLLNMVEDDKGNPKNARSFLQSNRAFRNNRMIQGKVQFIYTGSNSLNGTVTDLGSTELINDLPSMPVYPLEVGEAKQLMTEILGTYGISIGENELDYAIQKVDWLIPFYFQLLIQELLDLLEEGEPISNHRIDEAILQITQPRNNNHFHHYVKRMTRVFPGERMKFVSAFLTQLAQEPMLTKAQAINIAHENLTEQQVKIILTTLETDGYIVEVKENPGSYKFNSPILKIWWHSQEG